MAIEEELQRVRDEAAAHEEARKKAQAAIEEAEKEKEAQVKALEDADVSCPTP